MAKLDNKIAVLIKIREKKDILFGKFSDTLTKEKKVEEWKKICDFCKALRLIAKEKDFSYVRDVFWSNIKRATLAKKDNASKTGTAGGKNKKITPIDDIVMEIIGTNSPILDGLGLPDIMPNNSSQDQNTESNQPLQPVNPLEVDPSTSESTGSQNIKKVDANNKKQKRFITSKSKPHEEYKEEGTLKKRKLQLQLEFLALQNYKMKLEIYEMEKRLNVSHSEFANEIVRQRDAPQQNDYTQDLSVNEDGTHTQTVYISSDHTGSDDTSNVS